MPFLHWHAYIPHEILHVPIPCFFSFLREEAARYAALRAVKQYAGAALAPFVASRKRTFAAVLLSQVVVPRARHMFSSPL